MLCNALCGGGKKAETLICVMHACLLGGCPSGLLQQKQCKETNVPSAGNEKKKSCLKSCKWLLMRLCNVCKRNLLHNATVLLVPKHISFPKRMLENCIKHL